MTILWVALRAVVSSLVCFVSSLPVWLQGVMNDHNSMNAAAVHGTETKTLPLWHLVDLDQGDDGTLYESDVHIQSLDAKKRMLGASYPATEQKTSEAIIENLRPQSTPLASALVVKSFDLDKLIFRLVNKRNAETKVETSYIALSYRWNRKIRRHKPETGGEILVPTSPEMFRAILNEKESPSEGIWFDQTCIDQANEDEKAVSIGAMDTIYKCARVVVVALDDVELDRFEGSFLRNHFAVAGLDSRQFSRNTFNRSVREEEETYGTYVKEHPQLVTIIQKILHSDYFQRAWCNHELRLGRDLVFLAHVKDDTCSQQHTLVRMTTTSLYVLWKLVQIGDPESFTRLKDRCRSLNDFIDTKIISSGLRNANFGTLQAKQLSFNLMEANTSTWPLQAGGNPLLPPEHRLLDANLDKVSIILNEVGLLLSLRSRADINIKDADEKTCRELISEIGLAALEQKREILKATNPLTYSQT